MVLVLKAKWKRDFANQMNSSQQFKSWLPELMVARVKSETKSKNQILM